MLEPIYNLPLMSASDLVVGKGMGSTGAGWGLPLGDPYGDRFRLSRAATDNELIREFLGTAYACASLNADGVAKSTLRLYATVKPGEDEPKAYTRAVRVEKNFAHMQRMKARIAGVRSTVGDNSEEIREIKSHPILDLLNHPEPDPINGLGTYDHIWLTQIYLELIGRAYWLKDGSPRPRALWIIPPMAVREIFDTSTGEKIGYGIRQVNGEKIYPPEAVVKFGNPDPSHPRSGGYSPMRAAMRSTRLLGDGDAHINALLENGGFPGAVWSPKGDSEGGGIGSAEAQRVRAAFRQQFAQGGRGGLMVTEMPGSLNPFSYKPEEIIEIERAKWYKTQQCNAFGVPDTKLERNAANLAAAKTADFAHSKDAILPRCTRNEDTINRDIVPIFDKTGRLFVAYDSPIPDDQVFELEQNRVAGSLGAVTRNELRSSIGLPWRPWGEVPTIANNITTVNVETGLIDPSSTEMAKQQFRASQADADPETDNSDTNKAILALAIEMKNLAIELAKPKIEVVPVDLREERRSRNLKRLAEAGYSQPEIAAMKNGKHRAAGL